MIRISPKMLGPFCRAQYDAAVKAAPAMTRPLAAMNGLERSYSEVLEVLRHAGRIKIYSFESLKLRLAKRTWYTPDFHVIDSAGDHEFHECKGFWRDDARVKLKVAAEAYRWATFVAVTRDKHGGWNFERIIP